MTRLEALKDKLLDDGSNRVNVICSAIAFWVIVGGVFLSLPVVLVLVFGE